MPKDYLRPRKYDETDVLCDRRRTVCFFFFFLVPTFKDASCEFDGGLAGKMIFCRASPAGYRFPFRPFRRLSRQSPHSLRLCPTATTVIIIHETRTIISPARRSNYITFHAPPTFRSYIVLRVVFGLFGVFFIFCPLWTTWTSECSAFRSTLCGFLLLWTLGKTCDTRVSWCENTSVHIYVGILKVRQLYWRCHML